MFLIPTVETLARKRLLRLKGGKISLSYGTSLIVARSSIPAACVEVAPPAISPKGAVSVLLVAKLDQQTEGLLYRLLFGGLSTRLLRFGNQRIVDLNLGSHPGGPAMCVTSYAYD